MGNRRKSLLSPTSPAINILEIDNKGETIERTYGIKELLMRVGGVFKYDGSCCAALSGSNTTIKQRYSPIQYKDLRRLDFTYTPIEDEPTILVRKDAVIISLDPIRAVITSDTIILFLPNSSSDHLIYSPIADHIEVLSSL